MNAVSSRNTRRGATALKAAFVALVAAALVTGGSIAGVAQAQAATSAQVRAKAVRQARYRRHLAMAAAERKARQERYRRHLAARKARSKPKTRSLPRGWRTARVSWYGPGFYGRGMAGGGRLQIASMIVAHKRLPFGTRVQFWYNGRTITVPVMDRGPYVAGREFDLGPGTARYLGMMSVGTIQYRIIGL